MKQFAAACAFVLVTLLTSVSGFAQSGDPANRAAQMKQKLITELKMTDVQADSVVTINMSYRPQMHDIFQDQHLVRMKKRQR
jgi:outer membrane lipoprotein-sorting protein